MSYTCISDLVTLLCLEFVRLLLLCDACSLDSYDTRIISGYL
jgi:hypothetical protein